MIGHSHAKNIAITLTRADHIPTMRFALIHFAGVSETEGRSEPKAEPKIATIREQ
jgi:hypothetical protein